MRKLSAEAVAEPAASAEAQPGAAAVELLVVVSTVCLRTFQVKVVGRRHEIPALSDELYFYLFVAVSRWAGSAVL